MPTLLVALVLSFVTMLSVLSVPMMVSGSQPTMLTVDMAFRINAYGDYATANALGVITYLISAGAAILYLKRGMAKEAPMTRLVLPRVALAVSFSSPSPSS